MRVRWLAVPAALSVAGCGGNARDGAGLQPDAGAGRGEGSGSGGSQGSDSSAAGSAGGDPAAGGIGGEAEKALERVANSKCDAKQICCEESFDLCLTWEMEKLLDSAQSAAARGAAVDIQCVDEWVRHYEGIADCREDQEVVYTPCCSLVHGGRVAGERCGRDQCARGLSCSDAEDGICAEGCPPRQKEGEYCWFPHCEDGLRCDYSSGVGVCKRVAQRGEPCSGLQCAAGLVCLKGVCVDGKLQDEPCALHEECWSGRCFSGRCVRARPAACPTLK